MLKLNSDKLDK